MNKKFLSMILAIFMLLACMPISAFATSIASEDLPTIYVMEDVYGTPGETVSVKIGFKNTAGKSIQKFQAVLSAGEASIVSTTTIPITPVPASGGAGVVNSNGNFSYACGVGSFSHESYVTVQVTIPESAQNGDAYDLIISKSADFEEVLSWEGDVSSEGNIAFEGATLHVVNEAFIFNMDYDWEVIDEQAATARLVAYHGNATEILIPSIALGDGVTGTMDKEYTVVELYGSNETYEGVYSYNENITSITVPECVKKIDEYAITECPSLETLVVKSPDLEIVENDGETFLHYYGGKKIGYVLPEDLVIKSYESATVKTWADENEASFNNLFAFVGAQQGSDSIRFIGATADLDYRKIDLEITVSNQDKKFSKATSKVYITLNGYVDDILTPVVTTDSSVADVTGAYLVNDFAYLYGYAITGVPTTGTVEFEITPTAVTAGGVTVSGKTVTVVYTNGQLITE